MWRSVTTNRIRQNLWLIGAAAVVIAGFVVAGGLSPLLAAMGFVALAAVTLLATRTARVMPGSLPSAPAAVEKADRSQLQAIIEALPDPVVALDRNGVVVALNGRAHAM